MTHPDADFFDDLDEVIADDVYIGSTPDDLTQELRMNTWLISATQDQCSRLSGEDIVSFIRKLVADRQQKVSSAKRHGMLFYMWFDAQACQLRFSMISELHSLLPFKTAINQVETPDSIVAAFLDTNCHDGIPWDALVITETEAILKDTPPIQHKLDVYVKRLDA